MSESTPETLDNWPRQFTTGGKPRLGPITRLGNRYLRSLVVQGARSLVVHLSRTATALGRWVTRVCWELLKKSGESY